MSISPKTLLGRGIPLVLFLPLAALLYGVAIEPYWLDTQEPRAPLPRESDGWNGAKVAILADQQTGMWLDNEELIEAAVEATLEAEPDLILLAGDFIYHGDAEAVKEAVEMARPLGESSIPTFAVLGNHDYGMDKKHHEPDHDLAQMLANALEEAGIQVLENESVAVERNGDQLYVVGIGSHWAGLDDPRTAFANVPTDAARLVLMHNPVSWRSLPAYSAPVSVAGHTHGGQIRVPILPRHSWMDIAAERDEVVADRWVREKDLAQPGNWIYVSRGLGFSLVPMRLFCRPELTIMTLDASVETPIGS